jgi:nitrite reductase/ring-hydroxylating ferredoxin subunit
MPWTAGPLLSELPLGGTHLMKARGQALCLVRTEEGVFAVDDACPHEGYPLHQGAVVGCALTCIWHNYKFDVRDGACTMGEEDVRSHPVRVVGGRIEVDVQLPDPQAVQAKALISLREGLVEQQLGRVARELVRLLEAGVPPERLAMESALHDARRARWGSTHALPLAAEVLRYRVRPGAQAAYALMQAFELSAEANVRRPVRVRPAPEIPDDLEGVGDELRARVEAEDASGAEALLLGALQAGAAPSDVQAWLLQLCADHFLDFGHALIYVVKAFDLLGRAGWEFAGELLGSLVFGIVNGTREDLLPGWAGWRQRMAALEPRLPELFEAGLMAPSAWDRDAWLEAVLESSPKLAHQATVRALELGVPVLELVDGLSLAASERMLRLDPGLEVRVDVQNGWLDVTHILTFVNALRQAADRWRDPQILRLLFQALRFVNHSRLLDGERVAVIPEPGTLAQLQAAMAEGEVDLAVARAAALEDRDGAFRAIAQLALDDAMVRPIFTAHLIKTAFAAWEECDAVEDPRPLMALVRFVTAPRSERRLRRRVYEAIDFVVAGNIPKTLT